MMPPWNRVIRYGAGQWRGLVMLSVLILLGVGMELLKPWPLKLIIENILQGHPLPPGAAWIASVPGANSRSGLLLILTSATVLTFVGAWSFKMAQQYLQTGIGARMVYALAGDLFLHLQRLSLRFHGQQRTGDLVRRVSTDTECVRQFVLNVGIPLMTSLSSLAGMLWIMFQLNTPLAAAALLVTPALALAIAKLAGPMSRRSYAYYATQGQLTAKSEQILSALPLVRGFGQEAREDRAFRRIWQEADQRYRDLTHSQIQFRVATSSMTAIGTAVIMVCGGYQVLAGHIGVGTLVVFLSYVASLYAPLESLAYLSTSLSAASAGARRVCEVFDQGPAVAEVRDRRTAHATNLQAEGHIRFESVSFGYEKNCPVLHDICFEADPGRLIALVGRTGSGKSTLVSLVPRLFDPWQGRITLDSIDLRELRLADLRRNVSVVLQEPHLLPLSIAENIAYGRPGASRAEIIRAAENANAHEFIGALPDSYDTNIGEHGARLSGGQKQRIAIARALLKNAPVLVLDEPTSALDSESEAMVLEALYRLMEHRTTFLIAHRFSTIQKANMVLVLDQGEIVERGTPGDLARNSSYYQKLANLQFVPGHV